MFSHRCPLSQSSSPCPQSRLDSAWTSAVGTLLRADGGNGSRLARLHHGLALRLIRTAHLVFSARTRLAELCLVDYFGGFSSIGFCLRCAPRARGRQHKHTWAFKQEFDRFLGVGKLAPSFVVCDGASIDFFLRSSNCRGVCLCSGALRPGPPLRPGSTCGRCFRPVAWTLFPSTGFPPSRRFGCSTRHSCG